MNLDTPQPGFPFDGDYLESDYVLNQSEFQKVSLLQAGGVGPAESEWQGTVVERLNACRTPAGHPAIELADVDGLKVPVATRQVVTTTKCFAEATMATELTTRRGFQPAKITEKLPDGLIVLEATGSKQDWAHLLDTVRYLRGHDCPASLNYVVPLANQPPPPPAVGKSVGPPETPGPRLTPFAGYRARFTAPPPGPRPVVGVIDVGLPRGVRPDGWLAALPHDADNRDPVDALPKDGKPDAYAGHGTFVAGIVARVAPWADVRVYKALATDGLSTDTAIAAAMLRAVADGARILNLSLGCQTSTDLEPVAMTRAVEQILAAHGENVAIIAAAGNYGTERLVWPAALPGVVSVAGVTAALQPTKWSTQGGWVRCSTVAERVLSTYVDMTYTGDNPASEPTARWTGTSFAAPQIAGAVARVCYEKQWSPRAAAEKLIEKGTPVDGFGQAIEVLSVGT